MIDATRRRAALDTRDGLRLSRALRWILLIALVLRAAVAAAALHRDTMTSPDTLTYVRPAQSMLAVGRFESYGAPELARTPGYPVLLAVGERAGAVMPVTLALQVLLATLTVACVAALALELGREARVAALAATLCVFEPSGIIYTAKLLTETPFTTVVTAMLVVLTRWVRGHRTRYLVMGGALLALGCYVRPILYYAPLILAAMIGLIAWRRHARGARAFLDALMFVLIAGAPLVAWRARNMAVAGYDGFSAITDVNLFYYRAGGVVARRSGRAIDEVLMEMRREFGPDSVFAAGDRAARGRERAAKYYAMRTRARVILAGDPVAVVLDAGAAAARMVFGRDTSEWALLLGVEEGSLAWLVIKAVLTVLWLPVLMLAAVGLWRGRWDFALLLPALLVSVYLLALSAGPEAYSRFRLAVVPVLCVLAAQGALETARWVASWRASREPGGPIAT
ncbi:MAG TPA: glycosyltransferase family 39 protein [Gemmatimonadales bacterium]|nr:glycosyltransferase family 39 protein [Gemmatimonadales bacterium]